MFGNVSVSGPIAVVDVSRACHPPYPTIQVKLKGLGSSIPSIDLTVLQRIHPHPPWPSSTLQSPSSPSASPIHPKKSTPSKPSSVCLPSVQVSTSLPLRKTRLIARIDTFENGADRPSNMGIDMSTMRKIRDDWLAYDWFKTQDELNALPQFMAQVQDRDPRTGNEREFGIHFVAYESRKPGAIPVLLLHGWPGMGCFELLPMVDHLRKELKQPLDIIVPRYVFALLEVVFRADDLEACRDTCILPLLPSIQISISTTPQESCTTSCSGSGTSLATQRRASTGSHGTNPIAERFA